MRKALVVAPSWIGDTILAQPLFARLHERHPGLVLDAFAPAWAAPVLARMREIRHVMPNPFAHGEFNLAGRWRTAREVARVVVDSAAEFRALLNLVARLDGEMGDQRHLAQWAAERLGLDAKVVSDVLHIANELERSGIDAARLFPQYLAVTEQLARHIDEWPDQ